MKHFVRHLSMGSMLAAMLVTAPTIASAQSTPTPTPSNRPTNPAPPRGENMRTCNGQQCPSYRDRHPNAEYFSKKYDEVQMAKAMGTPVLARRTWMGAQTVARCLNDQAGEKAYDLVGGAVVKDPEYKSLAKGLNRTYRSCLTDEARDLPIQIVNAALMERLVLDHREEMTPGLGDRSPRLAQAFIMQDGKVNIDSVGRCTAVLSPAKAVAVLDTEPGSDAELESLSSVYGAAPQCGMKERPEMASIFQRSAVAGGLYYWATDRRGIVTLGED